MFLNLQIRSRQNLVLVVHFAFVFVGIGTTLLGVVLPALTKQFELNDAQNGGLSTAQYVGSIIGTLGTNFLWRRIGFLETLTIGLLAMAIGVGGIALADYWTIVAASIFLNGIGFGIAIPTTNLLIANVYRERAASALNVLNFAWGGGALACPAIFGLLGTQRSIVLPLLLLATALVVASIPLIFFRKTTTAVALAHEERIEKSGNISRDSENVWTTSFAVLIAALLFFYVGVENGLAYWLTSLTLRIESEQNTLLSASTIVFWAAFLFSRLCAPVWLGRLKSSSFILICLSIAAAGASLLLVSSDRSILNLAAALAGFGLAPIFPTSLAQFTNRFGSAATAAAKWLFVTSTVGGAFLTWLVGYLSKSFGNLRIGLGAALASILIMLVLQMLLIKESKAA